MNRTSLHSSSTTTSQSDVNLSVRQYTQLVSQDKVDFLLGPFEQFRAGHLLSRTAHVEADLVDQLFNSSEKRLARVLLLLANFGKGGKADSVIAKISQLRVAFGH